MRWARWSVPCPRGRLAAELPAWAMVPAALQAGQHLGARRLRAEAEGWCPLRADASEPSQELALGSAPHAVGPVPGSGKRAAPVPRPAVVGAGPVRAAAARVAGSAAWARQAVAQPPEGVAERGALPAAAPAGSDARAVAEPEELVVQAAQPRAEAAAWDAQVRHQAAAREDAEPERLGAVRGAAEPRAVRPSAVLGAVSEPPSAAASVCRRGRLLPVVPAPRPAARSRHALQSLQTASPSWRSWQAARDEVLSSVGSSPEWLE